MSGAIVPKASRSVLAFGFLTLLATPALAQSSHRRARTVLLVSAPEAPPEPVSRLAASLAGRLGAPDAAAMAESLDRSFPPPTPADWDPAPLLRGIETGRDHYYGGRFAEAVPVLAGALREARARIDRIGADDGLAAAVFSSQMLHVVALVRAERRADAMAVAREVRALFPGRRPTVAEFGPEVADLWNDAIDERRGDGGSVRVVAEHGRRKCTVFHNGRRAGESPIVLAGVPPGEMTLHASCGDTESRLRRLSLSARGATVRIDVAADASLETRQWVGLRSRGERGDVLAAVSIGAALGATKVALLRVEREGAEVEGAMLEVGGPARWRLLASARAAVGDATETARLVESLAEPEGPPASGWHTPASAGVALGAADGEGDRGSGAGMGSRGDAWWIAGGAGIAIAVVGGTLHAMGRGRATDALEARRASSRESAEASASTLLWTGSLLLPVGIGELVAGGTFFAVPPNGRGVFRGPLYTALVVTGSALAGIGASLLLADECEPFDTLCPAQGVARGPSVFGVGLAALGLGVGTMGAAVAMRTLEEPP